MNWYAPDLQIFIQVIVQDDIFVASTQNKTKIQVYAKEENKKYIFISILKV